MSTTTSNLGLYKPDLNDPADITKLNENWDKLDAVLGGSNDPSYIRYTLLASNWEGATVPYTYLVTGYDNKTIEVVEDVNMTVDQLGVIETAKIKSDPSSDENILYAFGVKPAMDVPVLLVVR